ncbi:putative 3-methyladenine DNA glycosylase [Pilimelia terevasa]|uniref:Putative 3-methyladenine DNA glycosylase n=1 Tax=Pilimelia terevasa TaxID=53372 RepID=A0A8J3BME6_9ACTN|nr:putative 3-methyladenine DNA glycosylase [Pilimelia terevasa]
MAARGLLGARLAAHGVTVALTEVEAYGGEGTDPPSHAHRGPTARNAVMFGRAGRAYVYFTYGVHWCLNVVTGPTGTAAAVLLRAGEVVGGVELARARRPAARADRDLARGPARLCAALGVDGTGNGVDLLDPAAPIRLAPAPAPAGEVRTGPRVGVSSGADVPWRFWVADAPTVSAYRRGGRPRTR